MCGIVGMAGTLIDKDLEIVKQLSYFDVVRGNHSTGFAFANRAGTVSWVKALGEPRNLCNALAIPDQEKQLKYLRKSDNFEELFDVDKYGDFSRTLAKPQLNLIIGHNRYATVGGITPETAHPFDVGPIIGVHNGTLTQYQLKNLEVYRPDEVDSRLLFEQIAHDKSIVKAYKKVSGAMACVVYDKENRTLYLWRNSQRPLFVRTNRAKTKIMWASKVWMMTGAIDTAKEQGSWDKDDIIELEPHKLYSFTLGEKGEIDQNDDITMSPFQYPTYQGRAYGSGYSGPNYGRQVVPFNPQAEKKNAETTLPATPTEEELKGVFAPTEDYYRKSAMAESATIDVIDKSKAFKKHKGNEWLSIVVGKDGEVIRKFGEPDLYDEKMKVGYFKPKVIEYSPNFQFDFIPGVARVIFPGLYKFAGKPLAERTWFYPRYELLQANIDFDKLWTEQYDLDFWIDFITTDNKKVKWSSEKRSFVFTSPDFRRITHDREFYHTQLLPKYRSYYNNLEKKFKDIAKNSSSYEENNNVDISNLDPRKQYPVYEGTVDAAGMKELLETIGGCPNCGNIPAPEVWEHLNWTSEQDFSCPMGTACPSLAIPYFH